jgi:PHIKZ077|nr:MAG TPA: baseplate protein [Bacteriophage sp.]
MLTQEELNKQLGIDLEKDPIDPEMAQAMANAELSTSATLNNEAQAYADKQIEEMTRPVSVEDIVLNHTEEEVFIRDENPIDIPVETAYTVPAKEDTEAIQEEPILVPADDERSHAELMEDIEVLKAKTKPLDVSHEVTKLEEANPTPAADVTPKEEKVDDRSVEDQRVDERSVEDKVLETVKKIGSDQSLWDFSKVNRDELEKVSIPVTLNPKKPILEDERVADFKNAKDTEDVIRAIQLTPDTPNNVVAKVKDNEPFSSDPNLPILTTSLSEGMEAVGSEAAFTQDVLRDEKNTFSQDISLGNRRDRVDYHRSTTRSNTGKATGRQARIIVQDALGIGSHFTVVLPHSGIVAIISAPLVNELVDLQTQLDQAKIQIGRLYGGSNYGLMTWYTAQKIVDLFIRKIAHINIKDDEYDPNTLRDIISPLDIPAIAFGLAAARYPDGYPYSRAVDITGGNRRMVTGTLYMSDMPLFVENRFSTRQKQFLISSEFNQTTLKEIEAYQRDWKAEVPEREYMIHRREDIKRHSRRKTVKEVWVTLGNTNISTMVEHGAAWDTYIRDAVNEVLEKAADERVRNDFITRKITATMLREYSHFIKKLTIKEYVDDSTDPVITEMDSGDTIIETLEMIGNDPEIVQNMVKTIIEYIQDQIKVLFTIPAAEEEIESNDSNNVSKLVIAINPVVVFFILTGKIYQSLAQ